MEPISKLELINSLVTLLETNGILNTQNVTTFIDCYRGNNNNNNNDLY